MGRGKVAFRQERSTDGTRIRGIAEVGDAPATFACFLEALAEDPGVRGEFVHQLQEVPFRAYRWECPALTRQVLGRPFEYMILDSPYLEMPPDPRDFQEHFTSAGDAQAVAFPNLGMDATMIAPCPLGTADDYAHLGAFTRSAPPEQQQELWCLVGRTLQQRLDERPVWLSTAGGGVAWLHVRLDDRPKYYAHGPYRDRTA